MAVKNYLRSRPADITRSAADVLSDMQADGEPLRDSERWTYAGLARRFGSEVVGQIDETLRAIPGMDWVRLALAANGLDFSETEVQTGISSLLASGAMSAETGMALKRIGIKPQTVWQSISGDAQLPNLDEIAREQQLISTEPSLVYDRRLVVLSVSLGTTAALSYRVQSAALQDGGGLNSGETLAVISTADADSANLNDRDRVLVDAVLSAIRTHAASI